MTGSLVEWTDAGFYCPRGDFHIDPRRAVGRAVITHAHGDHLSRGSAEYFTARPGAGLVRLRLRGGERDGRHRIVPLEYGEQRRFGEVTVSLHSAGHILGSAQVRIEAGGEVWVVSGDYKREPDPSCAPFEVVPCDTFVTEATFARPEFRWPPREGIADDLSAWWSANRRAGRVSVVFAYALGKAQSVLAEIGRRDSAGVLVHPDIEPLNELYRAQEIALPPTEVVPRKPSGRSFAGAIVLAPPRFAVETWYGRFGDVMTAGVSGWLQENGERARRGLDAGFPFSDHADWEAILRTIEECGAHRVITYHGDGRQLVAHLRERGLYAREATESAN